MRRFFLIAIILFLILVYPVFADDDITSGGVEDLMKYTNTAENPFLGQKQITDDEFQKTLKEVKAKQNRRKRKGKDKPFNGASYNEENNGDYIHETAEKNLLLTVPLCLKNGDGSEIPIGHYKIVGEKINNEVYLDFYESSTLVAKVPAIETNSDFDQPSINFVQLIPYNEQRVKIIYGSMDFNAYTFIKIENQISDMN